MSEKLTITCPHCNETLRVSATAAGKQVRCPQCQGIIRVPEPNQSERPRMRGWRVQTEDGKRYGPVALAELQQWIQEGRIHAHCQIAAEYEEKWMWATEMFPELAATGPDNPFGSLTPPTHPPM